MYGLGPISYISVTKGNDMVATSLKNTKGPFPNLNTVIMVEEVLSSMDESVISVADLKRKLPRKVNHNKLKIILRYLEESNKVLFTVDGITWIFNSDPNLRRAISQGYEL